MRVLFERYVQFAFPNGSRKKRLVVWYLYHWNTILWLRKKQCAQIQSCTVVLLNHTLHLNEHNPWTFPYKCFLNIRSEIEALILIFTDIDVRDFKIAHTRTPFFFEPWRCLKWHYTSVINSVCVARKQLMNLCFRPWRVWCCTSSCPLMTTSSQTLCTESTQTRNWKKSLNTSKAW